MKCLAMRIAGVDDTRDRSDILMLGQEIGVTSAEEALGIVAEYYPSNAVPPRTRLGIEQLFDRIGPREMPAKEPGR